MRSLKCWRTQGHKLYFYSRNDPNNRENHTEIDFLITEERKIAPIEVKSGKYRSQLFLDKFRKKFSKASAVPISFIPMT